MATFPTAGLGTPPVLPFGEIALLVLVLVLVLLLLVVVVVVVVVVEVLLVMEQGL